MAPRTKRRFHKTPVHQVPRVRPHADRQLTPMNSKSAPLTRCPWPSNDLSIRYHDEEWGTPAHDDNILFEFLILEGAQAGLSWDTILKKRENYRAAFDNFDPKKIARYDRRKIQTLMKNAGIIRNRLKIASAVQNAEAFLKVQEDFGSFDTYIWQFTGGSPRVNSWRSSKQVPASTAESDAMSKDLKKRGFSFVGTTICYAFMQAVGIVNDHLTSCFRYSELLPTRPY
jgi:DNA-3-methyladenine glycosylase I